MKPPPRPDGEEGRLAALRDYRLLDTLPDQALDDLTSLAAQICDAPVALISLVDEHRQWFKSRVGFSVAETARDISFCGHAILESDLFIVADASQDERFADSPLVTGEQQVRFYAGAPLVTPSGHAIGSLCVVDRRARELSASQRDALRMLSRQVMSQLEARKQAHALEKSEERLRIVTDNARVGLVVIDAERRYVYANTGYVEMLRLPSADIVGRRVADVLPAIYEDHIRPRLDRALAGERVTYDIDVRTPHGVRSYVVCDEPTGADGADRLVVVVVTEVTERKQAERARLAVEARYRALFEHAPDGIGIASPNGEYLDANPSFCRMLGYTREELLRVQVVDVVADAQAGQVAPTIASLRTGAPLNREWRLKRKDGSTFPAEVLATVMPDGNLLGVVRDLSERIRANELQRATDERARFALDSAGVGVWDQDGTSGRIRWSATQEAHHGLAPGAFRGTYEAFLERVHPEDREPLLAEIEKALQFSQDFSVQYRAVWPDGTVRWLNGAGRVQLDEHGKPGRSVGITLDVTGRRALEEQFHQAQKMEAIGRLAGGVAHDFNNLLNVILGYCEMLLVDLLPSDERRSDVIEIQKAGMRAANLTRQLLAFSRKEIISPALLDLNTVVSDMRTMLRRLIGEDIDVTINLGAGVARIKADRAQVEQIILNLAINARDAMPDGGRLTVQTANIDLDAHYTQMHPAVRPGRYVALIVADTGTGMTREVQQRLFEPFFTTKPQGKGTGLGLAAVHGIIARAGGSIGVYSEIDHGTTLKAYFPLAEAEAQPAETTPSVPRGRAPGATILIIEDADALRELTRKMLLRQGYAVLAASNADEGRRLFAEHPEIDLVLTDVVMPGTSGPALAKELADLRPAVKVVYMSGYTEDTIAHHGVLSSGIAFLHKPFTVDALARKVREVLDV